MYRSEQNVYCRQSASHVKVNGMLKQVQDVGRIRLRLRLSEVFRIQAGFALLLAAVAVLSRMPADLRGRALSPIDFTFVTSVLALAAYAVSRFVCCRFTCPLVAVLVGMVAGASFARPIDNPIELAALGTCVAFSWVVGLGWLDRRDGTPHYCRQVVMQASRAVGGWSARIVTAAIAKFKPLGALARPVPGQCHRCGGQRRQRQGGDADKQHIERDALRDLKRID